MVISKEEMDALEEYLSENKEEEPRIARSFLEDVIALYRTGFLSQNGLNKLEALTILNHRISQDDLADDINDALAVAKLALKDQILLDQNNLMVIAKSYFNFLTDTANRFQEMIAIDQTRQEEMTELLKKQIPIKIHKTTSREFLCPVCKKYIGVDSVRIPNFCSYCGQKLDWSVEE